MPGRIVLRTLVLFCALVLLGGAGATVATPPGKNGRIVFRGYLHAGRLTGALFTVNPDGTKIKRVTRPGFGVVDQEAEWSPNGRRIAFERKVPCPARGSRNGLDGTCDRVYTVRPDGTGLTALVPCGFRAAGAFPANCVGVHTPAWSPDGSKIVFRYSLVDQRYVDSLNVNAGIWVANSDGTGAHQITQTTPGGGAWDKEPQWSPDGSRLLFVRFDHKRDAEAVFVAAGDGSGATQLTAWELNASGGPDWSPDGRWILFTSYARSGASNLYKIHPDGTALTNLTKQSPRGHRYLSSSFSPNGAMLVTARTPGTGPAADVVVMKADGSGARRVTKTRLWESGADWGPRR